MDARQHFVVLGIIAVAFVIFLGQESSEDGYRSYCTVPEQVVAAWHTTIGDGLNAESARSFATLLTATLLHGGFQHVLMNMLFLWVFGSMASRHLGVWWPLPVFVFTGIIGSIVHVLLNRESSIPTLGASGAVCGFEGLYLGLALQWRMAWPDVWPIARPIPPLQLAALAVVGFAFDIYGIASQGHGVAFGAHIGGLLAGLFIAAVLTTIYPTEAAFRRSRLAG